MHTSKRNKIIKIIIICHNAGSNHNELFDITETVKTELLMTYLNNKINKITGSANLCPHGLLN